MNDMLRRFYEQFERRKEALSRAKSKRGEARAALAEAMFAVDGASAKFRECDDEE